MKKILISLALLLIAPATAQADTSVAGHVPWGEQACDLAGTCVTPLEAWQADGSHWTFEWGYKDPVQRPIMSSGVKIGLENVVWFRHWNPNRSDNAYEILSEKRRYYYPGTGYADKIASTEVKEFPEYNTPQCGKLTDPGTTGGAVSIIQAGPGVADTASLKHQCFPDVFDEQGSLIGDSQPSDTKPAATQPVDTTDDAPIVSSCIAVKVLKLSVKVTATDVGCFGARKVAAKIVRSSKVAGWKCSKKKRSATCTKGEASVAARW